METKQAVSKELLELLACPACKGPVEPTPDGRGLVCRAESLVYPVEDGIPVMLVDRAVPLGDWENGGG